MLFLCKVHCQSIAGRFSGLCGRISQYLILLQGLCEVSKWCIPTLVTQVHNPGGVNRGGSKVCTFHVFVPSLGTRKSWQPCLPWPLFYRPNQLHATNLFHWSIHKALNAKKKCIFCALGHKILLSGIQTWDWSLPQPSYPCQGPAPSKSGAISFKEKHCWSEHSQRAVWNRLQAANQRSAKYNQKSLKSKEHMAEPGCKGTPNLAGTACTFLCFWA